MLLLPLVCVIIYDLRNSSVFNVRLKVCSDGNDVIAGGSTFQTLASATGKARSPMVLFKVLKLSKSVLLPSPLLMSAFTVFYYMNISSPGFVSVWFTHCI